MKRKLTFIGVGILVVFLVLLGTYKLMNSRTFQLFGGLTDQVETDQKVVALTFDDGPTIMSINFCRFWINTTQRRPFFLLGMR